MASEIVQFALQNPAAFSQILATWVATTRIPSPHVSCSPLPSPAMISAQPAPQMSPCMMMTQSQQQQQQQQQQQLQDTDFFFGDLGFTSDCTGSDLEDLLELDVPCDPLDFSSSTSSSLSQSLLDFQLFSSSLHENESSPAMVVPKSSSNGCSVGPVSALSVPNYSSCSSQSSDSDHESIDEDEVPTPIKSKSVPKATSCSFPGCKRKFRRGANLHLHMESHEKTDSKPHVCTWPGCEWRFNRSDELSRHFRKHTGDRPYACEYCDKRFSRRDHLKTHYKVHKISSSSATPIPKKK